MFKSLLQEYNGRKADLRRQSGQDAVRLSSVAPVAGMHSCQTGARHLSVITCTQIRHVQVPSVLLRGWQLP